MDLVRGRGPRTTESISNLIFSIWKKINFQGFLGIDVSQEGGEGYQRNVQRTFMGKNQFVSLPLGFSTLAWRLGFSTCLVI